MKKNKQHSIGCSIKLSVSEFGRGRFWRFVVFDLLVFVGFLLVFVLFTFGTLKVVPALGALAPYSKEVFEMAQQGALDDEGEDFQVLSQNVKVIKSSIYGVAWKIAGIFAGCLALFTLIFATLQFFGWMPFFRYVFKRSRFWRFAALNLIWFFGWSVFLLLTLYMHRSMAGLMMFWIELLLMFYFTTFLHLSYFKERSMLESFSGAFVLALKLRSLLWLLLVLLVFVGVTVVSILLVKIHTIMFIPVIVLLMSTIPWGKVILFRFLFDKKCGVVIC